MTNYWADVVFARAGGGGNQPPTANNDSGFFVTQNTPLAIPASALLANDMDPNGYSLSLTGVSNPINGSVSYNATTNTVTFIPTTGYPSPNSTGAASFNYTISNGHSGTATGLVSLVVTVASSSLFSASSVPGTITANDPSAVELGEKSQASSAGKVIGVRFYKGPQNTGTHIGNLWSSAGALLAIATFSNETASGWQQANFASPVSRDGRSYLCRLLSLPVALYSADSNYFASAVTRWPADGSLSWANGGNRSYAYSSSSVFPTGTFNAANYWVRRCLRRIHADGKSATGCQQ